MILPLYLFTIVFVACPLIYVLMLSFTPQEGGFAFTLENYRRILEPVYLCDRLSFRVFYGKAAEREKRKGNAVSHAAFLG